VALPNIFTAAVKDALIERINGITPETQPKWGKMNAAQMLAHCNVTYEMAFEDKHKKAKGLKKWILTKLVKNTVVSEKPYKHNSTTAPQFLVSAQQDFEQQKERLIHYLNETVNLGEQHFDGKESNSFGNLSKAEWNNMFYKHLDHHLKQFGQ